MKTLDIFYEGEERTVHYSGEEPLLCTLLENDVPIDHSCEGMASCGTCRILVTDGISDLPPRNELEAEMAVDRNFSPHERLACQLCPTHSLKFKLPTD